MAVLSAAELIAGVCACVAPARCCGCDGAMADETLAFCAGCSPLIEQAPAPLLPPAPVAAVFVYGGPLADAIARMKYAGRTELARPLGQLLADAAVSYAGQAQVVIPMPLFPRRLRERGFNQSALLGAHAARALGVPLAVDRLWRVRDTAVQAGLTKVARAANVCGAFSAQPIAQRVLLVDDVRTTGATLASAAEALREAGCPEVVTLALAAAPR